MKTQRLQIILLALLVLIATRELCQAQSGWVSTRITFSAKDLNAVSFTDSKRGWVAGDGGFLAYTEDSGATWVERPLGISRSVNDIYFAGKDTGFALAGGTIFETSDGGH